MKRRERGARGQKEVRGSEGREGVGDAERASLFCL